MDKKFNTGCFNAGNCNAGNCNAGCFNAGNCNTGDYNTGYRNSGNGNTGDCNIGDYNTGYCNTGDYNIGDDNTGNWNTGDDNSGCCNTGDYNIGDDNTGCCNTGDYNAGSCNIGDFNTGYGNAGDQNARCFCASINPTITLFDKPSDWTLNDWHESEVYSIMRKSPSPLKWISIGNMTDEEKEAHPEAAETGGYLKQINIAEEAQKWWDALSDEDKREVMSLPNFDAEIFYECTKIRV